ncbi:hypothetical protein BsWGS_10617 [Bradybaena similaris]
MQGEIAPGTRLSKMAASVSLTITSRDGSTQTISHALEGREKHVVRYTELIQAINYVQEQSNAVLTTLVDQEKSQENGSTSFIVNDELKSTNNYNSSSGSKAETDDDDDEEEEEEDNEDDDKPPPDKKQKT